MVKAPHRPNRPRRGQIVISDLIVSLGLFVVLVVVAYQAWNQQISDVGDWRAQANAQEALRRGLDALTRTPGHPSNWAAAGLSPSSGSVVSMGAAQSDGVLEPYKLGRLAQYLGGYGAAANDTRAKMGLGAYQADGGVRLLNGSSILSFGNAPGGRAYVAATGQRMAMYDGQPVLVRLRIWRNDSS
ncbi:Uncharacterised protein [uncultured archaeon]|nr:Uncharacterised protein [uncultured archaeon]